MYEIKSPEERRQAAIDAFTAMANVLKDHGLSMERVPVYGKDEHVRVFFEHETNYVDVKADYEGFLEAIEELKNDPCFDKPNQQLINHNEWQKQYGRQLHKKDWNNP